MASIPKSTLSRNLIIAYVVLVAASVIGRSAGEGEFDEAFWITTLIGTGIAALIIGAIAWLMKKASHQKNLLKQSYIDRSQDLNPVNTNDSDDIEDGFYTVVADEISTGSIEKGAWTQAFSEADGNDVKAKAFYIKIRVRQLKREIERNAQDQSFEQESVKDRIRLLLEKLSQIPYEDAEHISRDDFRGSRSSFLEPVSVATASSVSGLLTFQIIDLIKRGFLDGFYDGENWHFELSPKSRGEQSGFGGTKRESNRVFTDQKSGLNLPDVELLKQRFGKKSSEELRLIVRDVHGHIWREEAREAALQLLLLRQAHHE